jgi:alpha-L-fucosidase 2
MVEIPQGQVPRTWQEYGSQSSNTGQEVSVMTLKAGSGSLLMVVDVDPLLNSDANYGYYRVLANFTVSVDGIGRVRNYTRTLDLETGIHSTRYTTATGSTVNTVVFCTYPDQVCVYHLDSDRALPNITVAFENLLVNSALLTQSCGNNTVRLTGYTRKGNPLGMKFDAMASVIGNDSSTTCTRNSALVITPANQTTSVTVVFGAGTDYDQKKGNKADNYSFRGADPGPALEATIARAMAKPYKKLLDGHIEDYSSYQGTFSLELPDSRSSAGLETSAVFNKYMSSSTGDPYLESLLFQFARHLFISSSRENSLPPNLQGIWTEKLNPDWNCDFHANINLQMNHWFADQTGLGPLQVALWNYMIDTWVPRGTETAKLVYDAPGWTTHPEGNAFGHTGMRSTAEWANGTYCSYIANI